MAQPQQPLQAADLHSTLLIRDCLEAPGAFLIAQALSLALGSAASPPGVERRVVLLAAAQAATHYSAVLRKAALNLPALVDAGRLTVVELLLLTAGGVPQLPSLAALHRLVAAAADAGGSSSQPVCLLVDDLTALRCLAASPAEWSAFLQACVALGAAPGCCFVGLAHDGVPEDADWLARLEHAAALVLDVEAVEPGSSAGTTATMVVTRRDVPLAVEAVAGAACGEGGAGAVPGVMRLCCQLGDAALLRCS